MQFKHLVDSFVEKTSSSKSSVTSSPNDVVRNEIAEMLDSVIEAGVEDGSDEHFYATQLLIKKSVDMCFLLLRNQKGSLHGLGEHGRRGRNVR
jgi:hypothetical protein